MNRVVLLIDNDLGFVFWLGRILDGSGYEVFPAKSVPDALKLISTLDLSVSLLIANDALPGLPQLVAGLRDSSPSLKVILLVDDLDTRRRLDADAQCRRPQRVDEHAAPGWLRVVERVFWDKAVVC